MLVFYFSICLTFSIKKREEVYIEIGLSLAHRYGETMEYTGPFFIKWEA